MEKIQSNTTKIIMPVTVYVVVFLEIYFKVLKIHLIICNLDCFMVGGCVYDFYLHNGKIIHKSYGGTDGQGFHNARG